MLSGGWAAGVNAYATVLLLGAYGRLGLGDVPDALERTDVMAAAAVLYAIEFVTDKIPYVDSLWDSISTVVRPTIGAVIGYQLAGDAESVNQALYATLGGGSALASHVVKAGNRLAINASPEPFTNATVSLGEDVTVAGVVTLALYHPWLALCIATVLFLTGAVLLVVLFRFVRRGWHRWRAKGPTAYA